MEKYTSAISLDDKIKKETDEINILHAHKMQLNNSLQYLQDQVNYHKQTMNIYHELGVMGFGLKEIKQLWNTILEITEANDISYKEAVTKFLDDIKKEYDNKLGFETKVKEKKGELVLLNKELNDTRRTLWFTQLIGPSLSNLFQKGISEQDIIIGINQLVEVCTNNPNIGTQNENTKNKISRSEYWKFLIDELKKYRNIKVAIKEQQENYEKLQKEVDYLNKQKQEITNYLQIVDLLHN